MHDLNYQRNLMIKELFANISLKTIKNTQSKCSQEGRPYFYVSIPTKVDEYHPEAIYFADKLKKNGLAFKALTSEYNAATTYLYFWQKKPNLYNKVRWTGIFGRPL